MCDSDFTDGIIHLFEHKIQCTIITTDVSIPNAEVFITYNLLDYLDSLLEVFQFMIFEKNTNFFFQMSLIHSNTGLLQKATISRKRKTNWIFLASQ